MFTSCKIESKEDEVLIYIIDFKQKEKSNKDSMKLKTIY